MPTSGAMDGGAQAAWSERRPGWPQRTSGDTAGAIPRGVVSVHAGVLRGSSRRGRRCGGALRGAGRAGTGPCHCGGTGARRHRRAAAAARGKRPRRPAAPRRHSRSSRHDRFARAEGDAGSDRSARPCRRRRSGRTPRDDRRGPHPRPRDRHAARRGAAAGRPSAQGGDARGRGPLGARAAVPTAQGNRIAPHAPRRATGAGNARGDRGGAEREDTARNAPGIARRRQQLGRRDGCDGPGRPAGTRERGRGCGGSGRGESTRCGRSRSGGG